MDINYVHHVPYLPFNYSHDVKNEECRGYGPITVKYVEDLSDKELELYGLDRTKIAEYKANRNIVKAQKNSNKSQYFNPRSFDKKSTTKKSTTKKSTTKRPSSNAMPCIIDGTRYETLTAGAKSMGTSRTTLTNALKARKSQLYGHDISWA